MSRYENYIVEIDDGQLSIDFPKEIEEEFDRNNKKMDWINEKNSKPSKFGGTRPVYIKDTKKFIEDINNVMEKFVRRSNTPTTRELLKQHIDCLFDKFIFSDEYNIRVEVNI